MIPYGGHDGAGRIARVATRRRGGRRAFNLGLKCTVLGCLSVYKPVNHYDEEVIRRARGASVLHFGLAALH